MTKLPVSVFAFLILSISGCVSKVHLNDSSNVESQGLVFSPKWYKRKGDTIDLMLVIKNKSDKATYVKRSSILVKAGQNSGDMKNKSGNYSTIESYPVGGSYYNAIHVVKWKSVSENIEISPESSFSDLFIFRFDSKVEKSIPLELVVNGIYEGTPEKTGQQRPPVRIPLTRL